ncbi:RNA polymerase sigma factor [Beduini massiliensis]|uniref:RNA polymerase sigma factor n=1 Tax=Beduini massiliensis TaxID=1585974 RepID=UPI00059A964D|nr:sigma-70 family RNA polymerase sigma factor [Beduini massiliensis]
MTNQQLNEIKDYLYQKLPKYLSHYYHVHSFDVDEIINETLYKCDLKYPAFRHESKTTTWAFGFAKYIAMNHFRKNIRYQKHIRIFEDQPAYSFDSPHQIMCRKQLFYDVRWAFHQLDFLQKQLIYYYVIKKTPRHKIYKHLNISRTYFDKLYHQAIYELKDKFIKKHYL